MEHGLPRMTAETAPFWEAAARGELVAPSCEQCAGWQWPPAGRSACCDAETKWHPVSGTGSVFSYTIVRRPPKKEGGEAPPSILAFVMLDEGFRMFTKLVGYRPEQVELGLRVQVDFETIGDSDRKLPVFAKSAI